MKNVTVSVPEEVYRAARVRAAEEGRSLSALVTDYLRGLAEQRSEFDRLAALQKRVQREIEGFSAADRIPRDEVHARAVR